MNRDGLRAAAAREGISDTSYSLEGGLPFERLVLSIVPGGWSVYCSQRMERIEEVFFDTEDEACSYLLATLVRDPNTRSARPG